jgi:hypothetical protein
MKTRLLLVTACLPLALACHSESNTPAASAAKRPIAAGSSASSSAPTTQDSAGAPAAQPSAELASMPFDPNGDAVAWSTDQFMLDPGQERYLCFAKTLDQDLVVNGYSAVGQRFVHHLIFARASAPEPEGFSECDTAFRRTWETLFISGAGNNRLEFPVDAGHQLKKGTQLIVQMHLLNVGGAPVEGSVTINMRRSSMENPRPVSSFIFGTAAVSLPARETSSVVGTCAVRQGLKLIAGFPHMHLLGSSLRFEVGKSRDAMQEVFARDPFNFDDQRIDMVDLTLSPGDMTRVTCTYNNTMDQEVGYGESTHNEMCFFVGFAVDLPRQAACLEVLPPNIFR